MFKGGEDRRVDWNASGRVSRAIVLTKRVFLDSDESSETKRIGVTKMHIQGRQTVALNMHRPIGAYKMHAGT